MKKETGVSPWLTAAWATFSGDGLLPVFQKEIARFSYDAYNTSDACWIVISWPNPPEEGNQYQANTEKTIDYRRIKIKDMKTSYRTAENLAYQPMDVSGKAVLITGGTTGIGRATALLLAAYGARVLIFGRHEQELDDTLQSYSGENGEGEIHGLIADSSGKEGIEQVFAAVDRQLGGLDILVNNAALAYNSIMEGSYNDWQYIVNTNLLGYMACAHEAVQRMKNAGGGHIVNIGSMSADVREKDSSVYVATKAGIQGFSEALRKEVNALGIKVTLIEPGAVGTDMQASTPPDKQREKEEKQEMLKAEDIAACVLYTISQPARCDVISVQIRPHLQVI